MAKPLNLVVACSENRIIGRAGRLPWRIPEDLKHFHDLTAGNICVLGRMCFETWPKVLDDGRQPVVITTQPERAHLHATNLTRAQQDCAPASDRVRVAATVTDALAIAQQLPGEIMICGGQRIYEETLPLADRLYLTLVHAEVPGDTTFPEWRHLNWRETSRRESHDASYRYTFSILERQA